MKRCFLTIFALACLMQVALAKEHPDSLLLVLDRTIAAREEFTAKKAEAIERLKERRKGAASPEDRYRINDRIIDHYTSFLCDSAVTYIRENLRIARGLANDAFLIESRLRLAFVYSLSGLFVQAEEQFRTIDFDRLDDPQKLTYCWTRIRYYENLIRYTDDTSLSADYAEAIRMLRREVMSLLPPGSEPYRKERAFELLDRGILDEPLQILTDVFDRQQPDTHDYAMAAMSLARLYRQAGDRAKENRFLELAAITDTRLSVKENEALLTLATNLFEQGDITRAYNYIGSALGDANFYNSRVKNTVIARIQPIIESNYLYRIEKQKRNLRLSAILLSLFIGALVIALAVIVVQMRMVSRARRNLWQLNRRLRALNRQLNEANVVKERYIGYFMNRCALYINKLHAFRKDVGHKLKSGQIDRLYRVPAKELENEYEELYRDFDEAFLKLYPDFVERFNALLRPEAHYPADGGRLNTELRIFALMRLGITNVNQVAEFLRCSVQTIYNYRSKVKNKARGEIASFEEAVRNIGPALPSGD